RSTILFSVAAGIAIILACLGLFGLAALITLQRTKEIGIRRVLGAGTGTITVLIARNFLELVTLSILIAVPFAWWAGNHWLEDFAFRVHVESYIFFLTAILTIVIVLGTVGFHALRVTLLNPVRSLRRD
ncbi:MAG TPA: FtsX-like permease family protein, partial [Puia sp.]|nr:FtsX-like permease family protein [Puia sp.]